MSSARIIAVAVALFALSHPVIGLICAAGACASPAEVGITVNAATGTVQAVQPGSTAAAAGLRSGDRVDFQRSGWTMHLWLWDGGLVAGRPFVLPIDRNGEPRSVTIVAGPQPIDIGALTFRIVQLLFGLVLMALACGVIFVRTDGLTLAFYAFCMLYVTADSTEWMRISPPIVMPLAALESLVPVLGYVGFVYLCLRFPTGQAVADSLVLFARSERRGVRLSVAPPSNARVPSGNAKPIFALPVVAGRNTIAVVLYGGHRDGEAIDAEEEHLLDALGQAAATAYEHLHAEERERENVALRERLRHLGAAY